MLGVQAMKAAEAGLYCGPLRLLAMEVYDALNAEGTPCNLVTGQERTVLPGASHMSCTVEMTSMSQRFDVAVLDEIQVRGGGACTADGVHGLIGKDNRRSAAQRHG